MKMLLKQGNDFFRVDQLQWCWNILRFPLVILSELEIVKFKKVRKYDHWKRKDDSVLRAAVEGEVERRRRHGRRRREWVDNIR